MKRYFYLLIIIFVIQGCNSSQVVIVDDDFRNDLATENSRIAADLFLDEFNNNLENLTYDYYLTYINVHESLSAKGLTDKIKKADGHLFKAKNRAFLLVLYYENEKCILGDISSTTLQDTIYWFKQDEKIPTVREFAGKIKF